jgi:hypothetical protein
MITQSLMISYKIPSLVTPAKEGVQKCLKRLDSRLHGNDRKRHFSIFYEAVKLHLLINLISQGQKSMPSPKTGCPPVRA